MVWSIRTIACIGKSLGREVDKSRHVFLFICLLYEYARMRHPLQSAPHEYRKRFFFTFLTLALVLFVVFGVLDAPLKNEVAPKGIVSLELAGTPQMARAITDSWKQVSLLLSATADRPNPDIVNIPYVFAAFGLGLDYLFMPVYALALGFGTLLASQKHTGWMHSLSVMAGYGAFVAALFDAVENYALFQVLLGRVDSNFPAIAAMCAIIKFGLIGFGFLVALAGWLLPEKRR